MTEARLPRSYAPMSFALALVLDRSGRRATKPPSSASIDIVSDEISRRALLDLAARR
jgi:hypothetical protein